MKSITYEQMRQEWERLVEEAYADWKTHNNTNTLQKVDFENRFVFPLVQISHRHSVAVILSNLEEQIINGGFYQYFYNAFYTEAGVADAVDRILDISTWHPSMRNLTKDDNDTAKILINLLKEFRSILKWPRGIFVTSRTALDDYCTFEDDQFEEINDRFFDHQEQINKFICGVIFYWPSDISPFHDIARQTVSLQ